MDTAQPPLPSPTQETYQELQRAYDFYNKHLFEGALPGCLFTYQRKKSCRGYFSSERFVRLGGSSADEIAMNPAFFAVVPVEGILSTLVHEQAHQWQKHFGAPGRRGYHNAEWAAKMKELGLYPSSTGKEGGKETGERMTHYILPYGRFLEVTQELLAGQFGLSWYDRYPVNASALYVPGDENDEEGEDGEEEGGDPHPDESGGDLLPAFGTRQIPPSSLTGDTTTTSAAPDGAPEGHTPGKATPTSTPEGQNTKLPPLKWKPTATPIAAGLDIARPTADGKDDEKPRPTTTRAKFTCPQCADAAWGKPSLHLICGKCNCTMN